MKETIQKLIYILKKKKEVVIATVIFLIAVAVAGSFLYAHRQKNLEAEKEKTTDEATVEEKTTDESSEEENETSYELPAISEVRGVWFSYYDWIALQTEDEEEFRTNAARVMEKGGMIQYGMEENGDPLFRFTAKEKSE